MSKLDIARGVTETEFLPAALEVQESPPSPLGRFVMWTVVAMINHPNASNGQPALDALLQWVANGPPPR